jgi:hypothetical protein
VDAAGYLSKKFLRSGRSSLRPALEKSDGSLSLSRERRCGHATLAENAVDRRTGPDLGVAVIAVLAGGGGGGGGGGYGY